MFCRKFYIKKNLFLIFLISVILLINFTNLKNIYKIRANNNSTNLIKNIETIETNFFKLKTTNGEIFNVDSNEYLIGVLAGEMPINHHEEALKAQVVAAYSYAIFHKILKQEPFVITDNFQKYLNKENRQKKFGTNFEKVESKLNSIVKSVSNEVITHNDEIINAVYFTSSPSKTASSFSVWGNNSNYLNSVDSEEPVIVKEFKINKNDLIQTVNNQVLNKNSKVNLNTSTNNNETNNENLKNTNLKNFQNYSSNVYESNLINQNEVNLKDSVKILACDKEGYVQKMSVFGQQISGSKFRSMFKLNSTNFEIKFLNDSELVCICKGLGHCVGMSQNGANELAKKGKKYDEILKHYYLNTKIQKIKSNNDMFNIFNKN